MLLDIKKFCNQVGRSAERRQINLCRGHLPSFLGIQRHQDMRRIGKSIHQSHAGHPTQTRRHMAEKRRPGWSGQRRHHGSRPAAVPDHRRGIDVPLQIIAAKHQVTRGQLIRGQFPFLSDIDLPARKRIQDHGRMKPFSRTSTIRLGGYRHADRPAAGIDQVQGGPVAIPTRIVGHHQSLRGFQRIHQPRNHQPIRAVNGQRSGERKTARQAKISACDSGEDVGQSQEGASMRGQDKTIRQRGFLFPSFP